MYYSSEKALQAGGRPVPEQCHTPECSPSEGNAVLPQFKTSYSFGLLLILSRLSAVFPLIEVLAYKYIPERLRELANRCKHTSNQGEHTFCFHPKVTKSLRPIRLLGEF